MDFNKKIIFLSIALLVLVFDQYTKYLSVRYLGTWQSFDITPFFSFTLNYNYGITFGMFNSNSANSMLWQRWVFSIIAILASIGIITWLIRSVKIDRFFASSLALILGGALGNAADRIRLGYVVDFIDFHLGKYHYPLFNIADSMIFIGVFIFILGTFITQRR